MWNAFSNRTYVYILLRNKIFLIRKNSILIKGGGFYLAKTFKLKSFWNQKIQKYRMALLRGGILFKEDFVKQENVTILDLKNMSFFRFENSFWKQIFELNIRETDCNSKIRFETNIRIKNSFRNELRFEFRFK